MMTSEQVEQLRAFVDAQDPVGYYSLLKQQGVGYASLALGFATSANSGSVVADVGSLYAMKYFEEKFKQYNGRLPTETEVAELKTALMRADFDGRVDKQDVLTVSEIADYHYIVYEQQGIPAQAWTGDTFSRRINDTLWCLTCTTAELNAGNAWEVFKNAISDFGTKFSSSDWQVFISDATFGKVLVDTILSYGSAHPLEAVAALALSGVVATVLPGISTVALTTLALRYMAPESWNQGLAVGALQVLDRSLSVASAMKLIDASADSLSFGTETIACFNAIRQQLPAVCAAEFTPENFADQVLSFIRLLHESGAQGGSITSPLLPELSGQSLAALAATDAGVRYMLESGSPFHVRWPGVAEPSFDTSFASYPPQYWADREVWLRGALQKNTNDSLLPEVGATLYLDRASGVQVTQGSETLGSQRVLFSGDGYQGSSDSDTVYGSNGNDVFQGGGGGDYLAGGRGDDWLGFTAAGMDNASVEERDSDGNVYDGGTGDDHISGSRSADTYIFRAGDGHDHILTQGGADVLRIQNDAHPETGQSISVTAADVRFVKNDLDLVVQLHGGADTVTVVGWFDSEQPQRLAVQLEGTSWSEKDISTQALSIENWPAAATGRTEQFTVYHEDGSTTQRTQYPEGGVRLIHESAFPEGSPDTGQLTQETRWYTSQGTLSSVRKTFFQAGFKQLNYAQGEVVGVWKGFADGSSVRIETSDQNGGMYEVHTEVLVRGQLLSTQSWGLLPQPVAGEDQIWALPYPFRMSFEEAQIARDEDGALVVLSASGTPYYLPARLEAGLVFDDGTTRTPVPESNLQDLPLWLTRSSGQVDASQVPSAGVLLDPALSGLTPAAYHDGQGQTWLEWGGASTTLFKLLLPTSGEALVIRSAEGAVLPASTWASPALKLQAGGESYEVALPEGALAVTLARELNFDSPSTTLVQKVNDLHVLFADGTQVLFKDWALRPAALDLRHVSGAQWDGATVASRIQAYVGDDSANTYTVQTAHGQEVYGGEGNDVLWGGALPGNDLLDGQGGDDRLYGRGGDDILIGGPGIDLLDGGDGDDVLHGDAQDDDLFGGAGDDQLHGGSGVNRLYGEAGHDILVGGQDRNILSGGAGNDVLYAHGSYDELYGGGDFDTYHPNVHDGAQRLLFEDAGGGVVDLSQYYEQGVGISVQKTSADQLVLSMSNGERLALNGWAHQAISLQAGDQTWGWAELVGLPSSFQLFGDGLG